MLTCTLLNIYCFNKVEYVHCFGSHLLSCSPDMDEMQQTLEKYRLRKRRKEKFVEYKEKVLKFLMRGFRRKENQEVVIDVDAKELDTCSETEECSPSETGDSDDDNNSELEITPTDLQKDKWLTYTLRIVYFLFWVTLYIIAIELKFGIVFLMLSALIGIYLNTRTDPKTHNEISAYSVFNKNCESIDGTLKAEQFEREIRYGPVALK